MTHEITGHPALDLTEIVRAITESVPDIPADLDPHAQFDDVDIDSLVLAETAVVATRIFRVNIEDWELRDAGTLSAAASLVQHRVAAARATDV
ncbi:phosphopantetheine-binding protein [Promicromonospora sp. CA-289599]|uniref:phosphopantetheine-binding protein n=1 Tax=Promicromonospora sp. CA-289599 TaxID=3240014 RepID=UPI003D94D660